MTAITLSLHSIIDLTDNFRLKIEGDSVSSTIASAINRISTDAFWNDPSTKRFIFKQLPYRLSKFQQALPESYSLEMISDYLLDIPGTVLFLRSL